MRALLRLVPASFRRRVALRLVPDLFAEIARERDEAIQKAAELDRREWRALHILSRLNSLVWSQQYPARETLTEAWKSAWDREPVFEHRMRSIEELRSDMDEKHEA